MPDSVLKPESGKSCVLCGTNSGIRAFASIEPDFKILICTDCRLGFTSPPPADSEIGKYYPEKYYGKENVRFNEFFEYLTRIFRKRRARVISRCTPVGRVLDVGCGRGLTLGYLKGMGYQAQGIELSDRAAWHARNVLGLDIETVEFLKAPCPNGEYNAVIFWHSFEHLRLPMESVDRARELLKPGGIICIAVPNFDSLQARWFGKYWFHLDIPRHYYHFSTRAVVEILSRRGFKVIQTDHFNFEQNPYGWLQSFYNQLGFENNFFYELLKNKNNRISEMLRHPFQTLATLLLLPILLPLSFLLTFLETLVRRGGSIEVYATKK